MIAVLEGTFRVQSIVRPPLVVSADGRGVVSHAGSRLLADLADRTTLTGQVSHKRLKRDAGEIAWAIPSVNDVQNNVTIVPRRRSRPIREAETPVVAGRKQA